MICKQHKHSYLQNVSAKIYRAVYPAELQFDVGLQNDEAECRYEMHGAGVVS